MDMNNTFVCETSYAFCQSVIRLPFDQECTWNKGARAFMYLAVLFYCFIGVAMVTNIFMESVATFGCRRQKRLNYDGRPNVNVNFWGNSLSNLMGSFVPLTMLCIVEAFSKNFEAGDFDAGAEAVFGTAIFNLFVTAAICIMTVPAGKYRRINNYPIFATTFAFSILAYVLIIAFTRIISFHVIVVWEAALLLACFIIFVIVVWLMEKKICPQPQQEISARSIELADGIIGRGETNKFLSRGTLNSEDLENYINEVRKYPGLTDDDTVLLAATLYEDSQPHSFLWYRTKAVQNCTGSKQGNPKMTDRLRKVYNAIKTAKHTPTTEDGIETDTNPNAVIEFQTSSSGVNENVGRFPVLIRRRGKTNNTALVRVESMDGTAIKDIDYKKVNDTVTFAAEETTKQVIVEIVADAVWESGKDFYLKLYMPYDQEQMEVQMGKTTITKISIYDNNEPGEFTFEKEGELVSRHNTTSNLELRVIRSKGADGHVSVRWKTIDKTAKSGRDYHGGEGILPFSHLATSNIITIPIITGNVSEEESSYFEVELMEPTTGSKLGAIRKFIVTIINDNNYFDRVMARTIALTNLRAESQSTYLSNIKNAIRVNHGDVHNTTFADYIMHFFTFGWKIVFSLIPPSSMLCGLPAFFISLIALFVITALMSDFASMFTCIIGLDFQGNIAFLVLPVGLSMPDLLAARLAVHNEQSADMVLTGIIASNSINIFLGLGLTWFISAVVHVFNGYHFHILSGMLVFRSLVIIVSSIVYIVILLIRRFTGCVGDRAEIGGNNKAKYFTGFIMLSLWIITIVNPFKF